MKLKNILLACIIVTGFTYADVRSNIAKVELTAEFQGAEGNKEAELDTFIKKIDELFQALIPSAHKKQMDRANQKKKYKILVVFHCCKN